MKQLQVALESKATISLRCFWGSGVGFYRQLGHIFLFGQAQLLMACGQLPIVDSWLEVWLELCQAEVL